ncbi:MAG TPA: hypothetical protein VEX57_17240 [Microlunatus sp.]|nr:hypothetical protein [Microlunatus sp.]
MRVDIKSGGDGVACWNAEAITAYAEAVDARETALTAANPDLVVTPGLVKCYGCETLEFDMGVGCTAKLIRTLYAVAGEVEPRPADAAGSLADITGLRNRIDKEDAVAQVSEVAPAAPATTAAPAAPAPSRAPVPPSAAPRRSGLKGLLGRRG